MSLKSDLSDLLDAAEKKVVALKDLAVSERNRLLDAIEHARGVVRSSEDPAVDAKPVVKQEKSAGK